MSLRGAMRLYEAGRFGEAAEAFGAGAASPTARFRRAECLSRLGRHDEAVAEAGEAARAAPREPAPALWLAQALAEAGRPADAAAVEFPAGHGAFVDPVREGYRALVPLAAADRTDAARTVTRIVESRHAAVYSLALRVAESQRLSAEPRWPDLPAVWYAHECALEMAEDGVERHPDPPDLPRGAAPTAGQAAAAVRWLRLHVTCADWSDLCTAIRRAPKVPPDLDEVEFETLLGAGRLDRAEALAARLAAEAGKDAAGELCLDRCRLAQLRGLPARPAEFEGHEDARRRLRPAVAWLEMADALLRGDALAARPLADAIADPSRREYVEAALLRWAGEPGLLVRAC